MVGRNWQNKRYAAAAATRATLTERFPVAFLPKGADKKPLKIGIDADVLAACPDLDPKHIRWAMNDYCTGFKYLRAVKVGAMRVDLHGNEVEAVTPESELAAQKTLYRAAAPRHIKSENSKLRDAIFKITKATEALHELALARVEKLMDAKPDTPEGQELDLLATAVQQYESVRWPI